MCRSTRAWRARSAMSPERPCRRRRAWSVSAAFGSPKTSEQEDGPARALRGRASFCSGREGGGPSLRDATRLRPRRRRGCRRGCRGGTRVGHLGQRAPRPEHVRSMTRLRVGQDDSPREIPADEGDLAFVGQPRRPATRSVATSGSMPYQIMSGKLGSSARPRHARRAARRSSSGPRSSGEHSLQGGGEGQPNHAATDPSRAMRREPVGRSDEVPLRRTAGGSPSRGRARSRDRAVRSGFLRSRPPVTCRAQRARSLSGHVGVCVAKIVRRPRWTAAHRLARRRALLEQPPGRADVPLVLVELEPDQFLVARAAARSTLTGLRLADT